MLYLYSNQISEIKNLDLLTSLQVLELYGNQISEIKNLEQLVKSSSLHKLYLYGITTNNLQIPREHFGTHSFDNCLEALRGYFESIEKGATHAKEVPVILVGNSTAGKTSLLAFIQQNVFPPPQDYSTHGVEPAVWLPDQQTIETLLEDNSLEDVGFYFWDFGGQEYYHATHRLFFSKKAIYVLLWEQKTNKQGVEPIRIRVKNEDASITEVQHPVEVFPYTYWLKTIRFLAPATEEAPILMIQNKLDEAFNNQEEYVSGELRGHFGISKEFHLSVKEAFEKRPKGKYYREFEAFLRQLFETARHQLALLARQTYWQQIKELLKQRKAENIWSEHQLLAALQQWDANITENGMLSYGLSLRDMGFIFYYPEDAYLKHYVFINPEWVMTSIYQVLDNSVLQKGGAFNLEHVIQQVGKPYAEVFIALMKKFELIFEHEDEGNLVYIAPQYLPEACQEKNALKYHKAALPDGGNTASLIVQFPDFMPSSVIQRLITAFGAQAESKIFWKHGGLFLLKDQHELIHVLIESNKPERKLFIRAKDHNRSAVWTVFQQLRRITENDNQLWLSVDNGVRFVQIQQLTDQIRNNNPNVQTQDQGTCPVKNFSWLLEAQQPLNIKEPKKTIRVFVSYAHKDQDYFNVLSRSLANS